MTRAAAVAACVFALTQGLLDAAGPEQRPRESGDSLPARITFSRDVAPVLFDHCAVCHHPGGTAPFSLVTYAEVRQRANQIALATTSGAMPPWKADAPPDEFIGQRPLSDNDVQLLKRWVEQGAPEGDRRDLPAVPGWADGWQLGKPDLVVSLPQAYTLPADGRDVFRIMVIPIPSGAVRYVTGLEFRPGNPTVVHHADIRLDRTPASRQFDAADPLPGYDGLLARSAVYPDGHLLGWAPGQIALPIPRNLAWRLEPGTDLVVQLHMKPSGKPESVQPSIGLWFSDQPPVQTPGMIRLGRQGIDIPAGERNYVITDTFTLPVDVDVQAVQPHAHYRAKDVKGTATLPDGTTRTLIHIKDWDFTWQQLYRYTKPMALPKGTTITMRYSYDNSADNPRNPELPPRRVQWGQLSSDEMGDLWIQVLTRDTRDLAALNRSFVPKMIAEDIVGYETAIRADPTRPALRDDVAQLYLQVGQAERAVQHFEVSARLQPGSAPAQLNLGVALAAVGRIDEAMDRYRQALTIRPDYPLAHENLARVYRALNNTPQAVAHLRQAVQLGPERVSALTDLAWILATTADDNVRTPSEALSLAERAVDLTARRDARALDVLGAAYASAGFFERAIDAADAARRLAPDGPIASAVDERRELYRQRQPYRVP